MINTIFKSGFRAGDIYYFRVAAAETAGTVKRVESGKKNRAAWRASSLLSREAAEIRKRSVVIARHRTSISVENGFWQVLLEVAGERGVSANRLITEIDRNRTGNLSSAIRLFVLAEVMKSEP